MSTYFREMSCNDFDNEEDFHMSSGNYEANDYMHDVDC